MLQPLKEIENERTLATPERMDSADGSMLILVLACFYCVFAWEGLINVYDNGLAQCPACGECAGIAMEDFMRYCEINN